MQVPDVRRQARGPCVEYRGEAARIFRYDALVDGEPFQAQLDTDALGRVLRYEGLWEAV